MLNKLSNSDCIICSSFQVAFGAGLVEAAYFGLSIISSNCKGPSEIVNKFNYILLKKYCKFLYKGNDINNFKKEIKIYSNKERCIS